MGWERAGGHNVFCKKLMKRAVDPRGFEPLTFCMPYRRASQLRHGPRWLATWAIILGEMRVDQAVGCE